MQACVCFVNHLAEVKVESFLFLVYYDNARLSLQCSHRQPTGNKVNSDLLHASSQTCVCVCETVKVSEDKYNVKVSSIYGNIETKGRHTNADMDMESG